MSHLHEVEQPIICNAYREPTEYWQITPGERPQRLPGRREACYYYRPPGTQAGEPGDDFGIPVPLELANRLRAAVRDWREAGYPGCSRVTRDLLAYWNSDDRDRQLFFCQREAAESVIFLAEARRDLLQGITVPSDEPGPEGVVAGYSAFRRYACKMATGTGKTTVMGMLIVWSILNKVADRNDKRFSDTVLVVCPNVTIREQLSRQIDPNQGELSLYRTRDLVPPDMMGQLRRGRVLVTNWHVFNPQDMNRVGSDGARVVKRGEESDTALIRRVLGEAAGRRNLLVINDEAHHAYRRGTTATDASDRNGNGDDEDRDEAERRNVEATVWVGGLDKLHKQKKINFCVDLSATPFYLVGSGNEPGRPFPWVVSDFGLIDAIESGIVKIPQLPVADSTGAAIPAYFNVWKTILGQLSAAERGGRRGKVKPEAILRYAKPPLGQLAGLWRQTFTEWRTAGRDVPPVFIVVCKDTALAQQVYAWLAEGGAAPEFANEPGREYTVRIDSKVVEALETGVARNDEEMRLRFVLATVGKSNWPDGRPPDAWVDLCARWNARARDQGGAMLDPAVPPGREVRCIVSVAMLTEGWDAPNVTHIAGLRPFQSQLLCEQVVGRGLRRTQYYDLRAEEVAQVYGVPFELIPFKARPVTPPPPQRVHHVCALKERSHLEIQFPRIEGYTVAIRSRVHVDWERVPTLALDPGHGYPDLTRLKGLSDPRSGRLSAWGPGQPTDADLTEWRRTHRLQTLEYELATELVRRFATNRETSIAPHVLFPQVLAAVQRYLHERVRPQGTTDRRDVFLEPNWSRAVDALLTALGPDTTRGEAPEVPYYERHRGAGSTGEVDFWTSRDVRPTEKSHVSAVVSDTETWEQSAAFYLETSTPVSCYVKNDHLGFAIPYLWRGERHDYVPDFLVRLADAGRDLGTLILEVKGGRDERAEEKEAGAKRWVAAVNNDRSERSCGHWAYHMVRNPADVPQTLAQAVEELRRARCTSVEGR